MEYKFSLQQSLPSSSTSGRLMTIDMQHQHNESHGVTLVAGINITDRRVIIDVDEENEIQYGRDSIDVSNIDD